MNPADREQLLRALWPQGAASPSVWAVLDGARDARIHVALMQSRLDYRCLYAGTLARELELAAPQLVELPYGHRLFDRWLDEGWASNWGVLLSIGDPANLRHHLRKLLKVEGVARRPVLFRFYDPRVLRAFLPQATAEQLREFFGPIDAWYAVDGEGALMAYRCDRQQRLQVQRAVVVTPAVSPAVLITPGG